MFSCRIVFTWIMFMGSWIGTRAKELPPPFHDHNNTVAVDNKWIIKLKNQEDTSDKIGLMCAEALGELGYQRFKGHCERHLRGNRMIVMHSDDKNEMSKLRNALSDDIEFIERDVIMTSFSTQDNTPWNLDRIGQRNLPLDGTYKPQEGFDGFGVHVYVVDTGIFAAHEQFAGRISFGSDMIDNDDDPEDCEGHGTHVAGIALGLDFGVAPGAILHGVRVLNCNGESTLDSVIAGLEWILDNHTSTFPGEGAVINLSLGAYVGPGQRIQSLDEVISELVSAGITVVAAAGNDMSDACSYSPANSRDVITVGSTDRPFESLDGISFFTNYGSCIDIFAPGSDIISASIGNTTNATQISSGTSQAAPHVTGAAAAYIGANPGATVAEVTNAIISSATNAIIDGFGVDKIYDNDNFILESHTPNKLLYVHFEDENDTRNPPPPPPFPPYPEIGPHCRELYVEIVADNFPDDILWWIEGPSGHVPGSAGNFSSKSVMLCETGLHKFRISDRSGNGICCENGEGSYALYLDDQKIFDGDGGFGWGAKAYFEVGDEISNATTIYAAHGEPAIPSHFPPPAPAIPLASIEPLTPAPAEKPPAPAEKPSAPAEKPPAPAEKTPLQEPVTQRDEKTHAKFEISTLIAAVVGIIALLSVTYFIFKRFNCFCCNRVQPIPEDNLDDLQKLAFVL